MSTLRTDNIQTTDSVTLVQVSDLALKSDFALVTAADTIGYKHPATGSQNSSVGNKLDSDISVLDFMTDAQRADAMLDTPVLDHTAAVQAFFDAIKATNYGVATLVGNLRVTSKISIINPKTRTLTASCKIISAFTAEDEVLLIKDAGISFRINGEVEIIGGGGNTYTTRTNGIGLKIDNCPRIRIDSVRTDFFKYDGVQIINGADVGGGNSNLWSIGKIRAEGCGSGRQGTLNGVSATISNISNTGSASSFAQRTILTLNAVPQGVRENDLIYIAGRLHYLESFDSGLNTVTIFPWISSSVTVGATISFYMGGALYTRGGDSGVGYVEQLDARNCGIAYNALSLYPSNIDNITSQFNAIGIRVGRGISGAAEGGYIGTAYSENNDFDVVRVTNYTDIGFKIASTGTILTSKCFALSPIDGSNNPIQPYSTLVGIDIATLTARPTLVTSSRTIGLDPKPGVVETLRANTATVTLVRDDETERVFNSSDAVLFVAGNGNNSAPSGTITFVPPSGCTINGGAVGASAAFATFSGPCLFYIRKEALNYVVQRCDQQVVLVGSTTYDWPSLAAAAQQTGPNITVTGAAVGDFVEVSMGISKQGTDVWGDVTASNTVTVYQRNGTAAPVDLASAIIYVRVKKRT